MPVPFRPPQSPEACRPLIAGLSQVKVYSENVVMAGEVAQRNALRTLALSRLTLL